MLEAGEPQSRMAGQAPVFPPGGWQTQVPTPPRALGMWEEASLGVCTSQIRRLGCQPRPPLTECMETLHWAAWSPEGMLGQMGIPAGLTPWRDKVS